MKSKRALFVQRIAAGGACAVLFGMGTARQADAQEGKTQKVEAERIGWGEPKDGLQIGLFPQSAQTSFRYGDTLMLVMRARNVSSAPIAITMKTLNIAVVTLGEKGRFVLQTLGGGGEAVPFRLAQGETVELPGGRFAARIVAVGEQEHQTENKGDAVALLPGEYHAECSTPIWMPDKDDATCATGHRASPGIFTFTVRGEAQRHAITRKNESALGAAIQWGEAVNGLQGGLQRISKKELTELPDTMYRSIAANEVLARFYVRNTTDKPLAISCHDFDENNLSPWVKDANDKDYLVRSVFTTGRRASREHLLQPGEILGTGWSRLKFQTLQTPLEANETTRTLMADAGQYTMRLIGSVRFSGLNNFDMTLVSGAIPFVIAPQ